MLRKMTKEEFLERFERDRARRDAEKDFRKYLESPENILSEYIRYKREKYWRRTRGRY